MPNPVLDQERIAFLKARVTTTPPRALLPAWPRQDKELAAVELEVSWVRFSTLNHRTKAEQLREVHRQGNSSLFSADPLGSVAQDAQYQILKSQEGFAELKVDLRERKQQEPAVVTAEGVLINGNRRAAALRSLFTEDNFLGAKYIRCLVLPEDATTDEIVDVETELQIAKDFKEDYSWVNEAMLIEELYQRERRDWNRVAQKMHRAVPDIRGQYEKIQQLNQLVALSNGAYLHIDFKENESAFEELAKHIRGKPREEAESVRAAYFLGTLAGVNYRDLRNLRRSDASALVRKEIESNPALNPLLKVAETTAPAAKGDALDDVLGDSQPKNGLSGLLSMFARRKPDQTVEFPAGGSVNVSDALRSLQGAIETAAQDAEEDHRDQAALDAPITRLQNAKTELDRALAALPRAKRYPEWSDAKFKKQLADVKKALADLERGD
jgi:hypothetical protein